MQLKDKVSEVKNFFGTMITDEQRIAVLGEGHTRYHDLVKQDEQAFWDYLCKNDFKRL